MHAALDVHAPDAHAPCFDQQADGVLQAVHIAAGVGLGAPHGDAFVVRVRRGGVVPVAGQALGLEGRHHGLVVPLLRGLGQKLGVVRGGGVLQQGVITLDGVEFLQVAAHHRVFMGIHHQDGAVVVHHLGQSAGLGGVQQQVVAVHVHAIGRDAGANGGAIGVGARHYHHVDPVQQGFQQAMGQFTADHEQRFAACGFVAVLLADEHYGGPPAGVQVGGFRARSAGHQQAKDGFTALRHAQVEQLGARGPTGSRVGQ